MPHPARLGLFGVIHLDRRGKVTAELDAFLGDAEAIFVEYPREPTDVETVAHLAVRVPLYLLGVTLAQLVLYTPLMLVFARDLLPTEIVAARTLASRHDLPVHPVDEHPNTRLRSAGPRLVAANWLGVAVLAWFVGPTVLATTATVALAAGIGPVLVRRTGYRWPALALAVLGLVGAVASFALGVVSALAILAGLVAFLVIAVTTVGQRNEAMLDRVQRIAGEEGYEDAVLVTGKAHLAGFVRLARERDLPVRDLHVSLWLRAGRTHEDPADASLPEIDVGGDDATGSPALAPGSEDAVLLQRTLAAGFDALLAFLVAFLALGGTVWFGVDRVHPVVLLLVGFGLAGLVWVGYYAGQEARRGRTLGKARFGLVTASADGGPVSTGQAVVRTLFQPIDAGLFGIGLVVALVTDRRQRIGDLVAGTVVGRASVGGETGGPPSSTETSEETGTVERDQATGPATETPATD